MEMEFRSRNNDFGVCVPTVQERKNSMLAAKNAVGGEAASAATELSFSHRPTTPHMLSSDEVEQTLTLMETEASQHNEELLHIHTGLDKERVARLLAMLR